ncbi:MAG: hypothetical protein QXP98_07505 [Thermoproteus sp.]
MWWKKWWAGGPWGGPWWAAQWSYDEWIDFHLKAAVWQIKGLAQFIKEYSDKLSQKDKEALAKELEDLLKALR